MPILDRYFVKPKILKPSPPTHSAITMLCLSVQRVSSFKLHDIINNIVSKALMAFCPMEAQDTLFYMEDLLYS